MAWKSRCVNVASLNSTRDIISVVRPLLLLESGVLYSDFIAIVGSMVDSLDAMKEDWSYD